TRCGASVVFHVLLFQTDERCLLCCDARTTLGATPGSTNGQRCPSAGSAARWAVPIGGWRLASAWSSSDGHPSSFHAAAVPAVSRHRILSQQEQRLHPRRGVTLSPLAQDQPLPDASRELAGID